MEDQLNSTFNNTFNITPFELNKLKASYAEDGHLEDYDLRQALYDIRDKMREHHGEDNWLSVDDNVTVPHVGRITTHDAKRFRDEERAKQNYSRIVRLAARESKKSVVQSQPSRSEIKYPRRTARKKRSSDRAQSKHKRPRRECSKIKGR